MEFDGNMRIALSKHDIVLGAYLHEKILGADFRFCINLLPLPPIENCF